MGYLNREIERKFVVLKEASLKSALKTLRNAFKNCHRTIKGDSTDIYFNTPGKIKADFARVRMLPRGKAQLTIKHTDKKSIINRVEIDVTVADPFQAIAFCTQLFGLPAKLVRKKYFVLILDGHETNASLYRVYGDKRIFLEVEARTKNKVNKISNLLSKAFDLQPEGRSVYQMFVRGKK